MCVSHKGLENDYPWYNRNVDQQKKMIFQNTDWDTQELHLRYTKPVKNPPPPKIVVRTQQMATENSSIFNGNPK